MIQGYKLHVFLTSEGGWSYPSSHDWSSIAGYAGAGAIFGGRAEECHWGGRFSVPERLGDTYILCKCWEFAMVGNTQAIGCGPPGVMLWLGSGNAR